MLNRRTSTPSKKNFNRIDSIEHCPISITMKTKSICIQTDTKVEKYSNTMNFFNDILLQGKTMNDNDFENFIKGKQQENIGSLLRNMNENFYYEK